MNPVQPIFLLGLFLKGLRDHWRKRIDTINTFTFFAVPNMTKIVEFLGILINKNGHSELIRVAIILWVSLIYILKLLCGAHIRQNEKFLLTLQSEKIIYPFDPSYQW